MTNNTDEQKPFTMASKAMIRLTEKFDLMSKRVNELEQRTIDLSVRMNSVEDTKRRPYPYQ